MGLHNKGGCRLQSLSLATEHVWLARVPTRSRSTGHVWLAGADCKRKQNCLAIFHSNVNLLSIDSMSTCMLMTICCAMLSIDSMYTCVLMTICCATLSIDSM